MNEVPKNNPHPKFEDCIEQIDAEINKKHKKYSINLSYMDWDDVRQKIRLHLWKKWDKYDPSKPLAHWVQRIAGNQIINIIRNNYGNFQSPCYRCQFNINESCSKYGETENILCKEYKRWSSKGRYRCNMLTAESINQPRSFKDGESIGWDIEDNFSNLKDDSSIHSKFNFFIGRDLTKVEWRLYECLYINKLEKDDAINSLGYCRKTFERIEAKVYEKAKYIAKMLDYN